MQRLFLIAFSFLVLTVTFSNPSYACTAPSGEEGQIVYNVDHRIMQFCNGISWIAMAVTNDTVNALDSLSNVRDPLNPVDKQVLTWNQTAGEWVAQNIANNLENIADVADGLTPTDLQVLTWDDSGSEWVAADDVTDYQIPDSAAVCGASTDGLIRYNSNKLQLCIDGTGWSDVGSGAAGGAWTISTDDVILALSGNVGIGTPTPGTKLHVEGTASTDTVILDSVTTIPAPSGIGQISWRVPDTSTTCNASRHGTIRFNAGALQVCISTGAGWTNVDSGGVDEEPDAFTFTALTDQTIGGQVTSNSITIAGMGNTPVTATITGDGSPEFRVNGGSWVTTGAVSNGMTVELRLTTSSSPSTMRSATFTAGLTNAQWDVTTSAALYSFTSHSFHNCGARGDNRAGPTLSNCTTLYEPKDGNWDENTSFFNMTTQGYQLWTVPMDGDYVITLGAGSGGTGFNSYSDSYRGRGRIVQGTISLTQGDVLIIVVGQQGEDSYNNSSRGGGGGGGSFVALGATQSSATILAVAGAGGGGQASNHGWSGRYAGDGNGYSTNYGDTERNWGGYVGNGASISNTGRTQYSSPNYAQPFRTTMLGGQGDCYSVNGGFGGGGAPHCHNGAGGGGYHGGAGGNGASHAGEGGGSYLINTMTNTNTNIGLNHGHGFVTIKLATADLTPGANDGSSNTAPGTSCQQIKEEHPSSSDGVYWLDPDESGTDFTPFQAYCDMTRDGGGWTLVYKNMNGSGLAGSNRNEIGTPSSCLINTTHNCSAKFSDDAINAIRSVNSNHVAYRVDSPEISTSSYSYFFPGTCRYQHVGHYDPQCRKVRSGYSTSEAPQYWQCSGNSNWGGGSGGLTAWYGCRGIHGNYTNVVSTHKSSYSEVGGITTNTGMTNSGSSNTNYGYGVYMWVR